MIKLNKINKVYKTGLISLHALKDIDLEIEQGEFVAIMGASGSGKSTLMHILGFLDPPDMGNYSFKEKQVATLDEAELTGMRNDVAGFVFQQFHLLPGLKAYENVALPLVYAGDQETKVKAVEKLSIVGLGERTEHLPNELSGGERQRVAIARSLVNDPLILFADEPTGNLDSKSEAEIMKIFQGLNEKGITVVMVTHDNSVAAYAKRIITMKDGEIISDQKKQNKTEIKDSNNNISINPKTNIQWIDHVKQALFSIKTNKLRAFLSMLGILIGVAAVITMMAIGTGATKSIEADLSKLGSNLLIIKTGNDKSYKVSLGVGNNDRLELKDIEDVRNLELTGNTSGVVSGKVQAVYLNNNWRTDVLGVNTDYQFIRDSVPEIGRYFTQEELNNKEKVAVLGQTVATELFGEDSPLGKRIKLNNIFFEVIGVLPEKGYARGRDEDDTINVPLNTAMTRLLGEDYVKDIQVEVNDKEKMEEATNQIKELINKNHNWDADDELVDIQDMTEIQDAIKGTTNTISLLLGFVAGIALVVGGIGIMNIMLVSVIERTREIGIRKAIGAHKKDILFQFLVESVVITVTGGLIGILSGATVSMTISFLAGWTTVITFSSVLLSTGFSMLVGIVFGLWPAKQAADLNTINALRYE